MKTLLNILLVVILLPFLANGNEVPHLIKTQEDFTTAYLDFTNPQIFTYVADIQEGIIGTNHSHPIDHVFDNVFHIDIPQSIKSTGKVWLVYELYGLMNYSNVARSINSNQSSGGYIIEEHNDWTYQEELINPNWLNKGNNFITFSLPENATYSYSVRNLKIIIDRSEILPQNTVIINHSLQNYYNNQAYIRGFLTGQPNEVQVMIDDLPIQIIEGEFEYLAAKPESDSESWSVELKLLSESNVLKQQLHFENQKEVSLVHPIKTKGQTVIEEFHSTTTATLRSFGTSITIPTNALDQSTIISITPLRDIDLPTIKQDLTNLTNQHNGYRFLPHGRTFKEPVKIEIEYNPDLIPAGYTPEDIRTFFFEEASRRWIPLPKDSLIKESHKLVSTTTHFTDFITGIIKKPEAPESRSFTSNEIKDLKAGAANAGIVMIPPPTANNMGTVNLNFSIKIPPGRQGMQPNVSINYNSGGGNGWIGLGWNLSFSSISIETNWGVPRMNKEFESETYMLDGQQMVPVAHREQLRKREKDKNDFHLRIEGSFQKIIRHGDQPTNYWWEVISKAGVRSFYGGHPDSLVIENSVLRDMDGNIMHWSIYEQQDPNDNYVRYYCKIQKDKGIENGDIDGKQIYIDRITYTEHKTTKGTYAVQFVRDRDAKKNGWVKRKDVQISGRLRFKQVTADLLNKIEVYHNGSIVRSYELDYLEGAFHKTLLKSISEFDKVGALFNKHTFHYYDDVREKQDNTYRPYTDPVDWEITLDDITGGFKNTLDKFGDETSMLSGSKSNNFGVGASATIGGPGNLLSKIGTVGGHFSFSSSKSEGLISLIDIDGDGLPDKLFKKGDFLYYRKNLGANNKGGTFSSIAIQVEGINNFNKSKTKSTSNGWEANPVVYVANNKTKSRTTNPIFISDFNGDGLVDIAKNRLVFFNTIDTSSLASNFTLTSNQSASVVFSDNSLASSFEQSQTDLQEELEKENPLHDVVRVWEASFDGEVAIKAPVQIRQVVCDSEDEECFKKDGVRLVIQHKQERLWIDSLDADDSATLYPSKVGQEHLNYIKQNVKKGERIYFRVQSRINGIHDQVSWNPEIVYLNKDTSELDVQGKSLYKYKALEDFIVTGYQSVVMPKKGKIFVDGIFEKPTTSDDVLVTIIRKNPNVNDTIYAKELSWQNPFKETFQQIVEVEEKDTINFTVNTDSNIDWSAISWMPRITYLEATNTIDSEVVPLPVLDTTINVSVDMITGDTIKTEEIDSLIQIVPAVGYSMFNEVFRTPRKIKVKEDGNCIISPNILGGLGFPSVRINEVSLTITVKGINKLYGKQTYHIGEGFIPTATSLAAFSVPVTKDDSIYIEAHIDDYEVAAILYNRISFDIRLPREIITTGNVGLYSKLNMDREIYGPMYRGWGHFVYNGNQGRASLDIDENEIEEQKKKLKDLRKNDIPKVNDDEELSEDDESKIRGVSESNFIMMMPDPVTNSWMGQDNLTFIKADTVSSSRLGEDDILMDDLLEDSNEGNTILTTIIKKTYSKSKSKSFGVAGISKSKTNNDTDIQLDIIDFNGDRFPDIISREEIDDKLFSRIQYTSARGGLEEESILHPLSTHTAKSVASGIGASGAFAASYTSNTGFTFSSPVSKMKQAIARLKGSASSAEKTGEAGKSGVGVSPTGSFNNNVDTTRTTWMDINGDGLPDQLTADGMVALNIGYDFLEPEPWGFEGIRYGESKDFSAGLGVSFNNIQVGVSLTRSDNEALHALQDVNGDGLADIIESDKVRINTGNGFGPEQSWSGLEQIDAGSSTGESANVGFTVCFPVFFIRVCVSPNSNIGKGVNRQSTQLTDINGDGFSDYLESNNDGNLTVRSSAIGRTNLLKIVERPLKSSFTVDYKVVGNTYELPQGKWVLAETALFDGYKGDGVDTIKFKFDYEDGFFERHERDFFGFKTVKSHQIDENNDTYRTTIHEYYNRKYHLKGLLAKEIIQDSLGNRYTETHNEYRLKSIQSNQFLGDDFDKWNLTGQPLKAAAAAFPALVKTTELYYEGQPTAGLIKTMTYGYDELGNVITYTDSGDGTNKDERSAIITYHDIPDKYIKATPSNIIVNTSQGRIRKRETTIDGNGNITQIRQYLKSEKYAPYNMEFDQYGNLIKIIRPPNYDNDSLHFEYTYDDVVQTYVTEVKDGYGYTSSSVYEYEFGQLLEATDINNKTIKYTIDERGRLDTIIGPYELGKVDYTINFEYHPEGDVPYAITKHYDPEHKQDIVTYAFIDGLQRALQVKKTGSVFTNPNQDDEVQLIVSGRVVFDAFGRTIENYYPVTESEADGITFNTAFHEKALPTTTTFDVLDRPLSVTLPDRSITNYSYSIELDNNQFLGFKTTVIDGLGNQKDQYKDLRGRNRTTTDHYEDGGKIWTNFSYNAVSELTEVKDDERNITLFTYDHLGRKLSRTHPDAGKTEYKYDLANNLLEKITENIRRTIPDGGAIKYSYEKERIIGIDYPKNYQNKVTYHYGEAGDTLNRAGRIWLQEDASGGQEFFYGPLGEVIKNIRTILIDNNRVLTFVSEYEYDTWARTKKMVYPDGEVVYFKYNRAGKLQEMYGEKNNTRYDYVNCLGYDEFEQRVFLESGNGTQTTYAYEDDRRRLETMKVHNDSRKAIMNNSYQYDVVNNVKSITNQIPQPGLYKLGGPTTHTYSYDKLYRLTHAEGTWQGHQRQEEYTLDMEYDDLHNIRHKTQTHHKNGEEVPATSYTLDYSYDGTQPHAPTQIGNTSYSFDGNGNQIASRGNRHFASRQLIWDEENRIQRISQNGTLNQYTYDADGERVIKSSGGIQGVFINGTPTGFINHRDNFTVYVSPYLVARDGNFTKHYYIEGQRILSKLGSGKFTSYISSAAPAITAGNLDYRERLALLDKAVREYYTQFLDRPPGEPTTYGASAQPEATGQPIPSLVLDGDYSRPSDNWPQEPIIKDRNGPPGEPIQYGKPITNETVSAGYGYSDNGLYQEKDQYFYHPDHLGSTSYITDLSGEIRQHVSYMPFGEIFVEEHTSSDSQPYLFNSKELDRETGLYYYGARYYDPTTSIWMSVDPLADEYYGWSPYNYVLQNPIKLIDPDGKGVYYDRSGIYLGTDGNKDNKVFLLNKGKRAKTENTNVNWGGNLAETHVSDLQSNSSEVGGLIIQNRTKEGEDWTTSEFKTVGGENNVEGFMLEPGGPSTTTPNQDKRIPEGVYDLDDYSSAKYPDHFVLSNEDVPKSRKILYHEGNSPDDTEGCLLPGRTRKDGYVGPSRPKMKELRTFIKSKGASNVKTIITDNFAKENEK